MKNISNIQFPSDRNIIIKLYKKTREKKIIWYKQSSINNIEEWKASEKITKNKSLIFKIIHDTKYPELSYISFYLAKFYTENNKKKGDFRLIKKIENPSIVLLLLKMALIKSGYKLIDYLFFIIPDKNNDDNVLIKKSETNNYSLPHIKFNKSVTNIKKYIISYCENTVNITPTNIKKIKYRNIIPIKNDNLQYIYITPYLILDYEKELDKELNFIDINRLYNYFINDESIRILEYYEDNKLPF